MEQGYTLELPARIEAVLFFKGSPVTTTFLARTLHVSEEEVRGGVLLLERMFAEARRGISLIQKGDEVMLATVPAMSTTIETIAKEDTVRELGKAGLETLSLILYRGPISRSSINYIRGVNSNYILRSLLVRGLAEKVEDGTRAVAYQPTFELLSHLGVTKVEDLPEYGEVKKTLQEFADAHNKDEYEEDESVSEEA